jgi:hypothetical protein
VNSAAFAPPGRTVRCAKCHHSWFQAPPAEEELALVDDTSTAEAPVIKRPLPPPPAPPQPAKPTPVRMPEPEAPSVRHADIPAQQPATFPQPTPFQAPPVTPRVAPAPPPIVREEPEPEPEEQVPEVAQAPQPARSQLRSTPPPRMPHIETKVYVPPPPDRSGRWRRIGVIAIWLAVLVGIGAVAMALIEYRRSIMEAWPPTATLYSLFGFDVNVRGLEFRDVSFVMNEADIQRNKPRELVIRGEIVNLTEEEQVVPMVRIGLRDARQEEIYHWTFKAKAERIAPGASLPFLTQLMNPPTEAMDFEVRFAQPDE